MSPAWVRRIALINIIANVVVVVTGGAVRLTGSGLGCPSWPNCSPESFHATTEMGIHGAIEWGNRLFGVVVGLIALLGLIAAWKRKPRRTSLVKVSALLLAGIPAQAVIGGITVMTGLNPYTVAGHFLASIGVMVAAVAFWVRSGEPDGPPRAVVPRPLRVLAWSITGTALAAIVIGTLVTGSGPHGGDPATPRLNIDGHLITQLHADAVFLLIGLTVAMVLALRAVKAPRAALVAAYWLLGVELGQGVIGYVQYFTNVPALLVGAHMLGASVLWIAALLLPFRTRVRDVADLPVPGPRQVPAEAAS
ncbi:cytochrome b561 [Actinorhabdospora filicis]|uniref:Cytochrome b561 n=1 Tax=Actinorhabdospora filicis TaxID=1785913 RepID=A0A9W6WAD6_9ACTN|nr:COX15/CtaA family protein [Actinorhabdospora filicis]GLZ78908.1 cytochrome b561 [Actinorhabdospora filicis]